MDTQDFEPIADGDIDVADKDTALDAAADFDTDFTVDVDSDANFDSTSVAGELESAADDGMMDNLRQLASSPEIAELRRKAEARAEREKNSKWYVLHTYSGYENMVVENLKTVFEKNTTEANRLNERLFEIKVPMEDIVEEKKGKFKVVERRRFPCYVFIKMDYDNSMWHMIANTRGVTGFVGPQGRPLPLTEDEIKRMKLEASSIEIDYEIGEKVKVTDGALMGMVGDIVSIDPTGGKCRIIVRMFERDTPADLTFAQIEKLQ